MNNVLLLYSTTDGQTRRIADFLAEVFAEQGVAATVLPLAGAEETDWQGFARVVIGASIRYGKHKPEVLDFVNRHADALAEKGAAFFSVSAVARKAEKRVPGNNLYMKKFLAKSRWQPAHIAIFAGRIHYALYKPLDRLMIRLIMRITKGPTAPDANVEFTDWADVRGFAERLCREWENFS
ncbi:MAG: menaquinone-dependent protoporphyrinogen IX dehydrogenase [Cardiobacteriaceae bacterium]|nr:menaquinone-dependent protoporphyrinogen IX dehydrogenase [Cardiobacteriaceae bacterium]